MSYQVRLLDLTHRAFFLYDGPPVTATPADGDRGATKGRFGDNPFSKLILKDEKTDDPIALYSTYGGRTIGRNRCTLATGPHPIFPALAA